MKLPRDAPYLQLLIHHPGHLAGHRLQFVLNGSDTRPSGAAAPQVVQVGEQLEGGVRGGVSGEMLPGVQTVTTLMSHIPSWSSWRPS